MYHYDMYHYFVKLGWYYDPFPFSFIKDTVSFWNYWDLLLCLLTQSDSDVVVLTSGILTITTLLPLVPASIGPWLHDLFDIFTRLSSFRAHRQGKMLFMMLLDVVFWNHLFIQLEMIMQWFPKPSCLGLLNNVLWVCLSKICLSLVIQFSAAVLVLSSAIFSDGGGYIMSIFWEIKF